MTLMSEFTLSGSEGSLESRELEAVKVKGKEQAVKIYEIVAPKTARPCLRRGSRFAEALARRAPIGWPA